CKGRMADPRQRALGIEAARAPANDAGKTRERPVLSASCEFPSLGVNRHQTATRKGPNVRPAELVQRQIPAGNRPAPVAQRRGKSLSPLCPVRYIVGARVVRPSFGPIHLHVGMSFM